MLHAKGDVQGTERALREALSIRRNLGNEVHIGSILYRLAENLAAQGRLEEAEHVVRECKATYARAAPGTWRLHHAMSLLGSVLASRGKHAEAEKHLLEAYDQLDPKDDAGRRRETLNFIVKLYEAWGKPQKAEAWRAKR